MTKALIRIFAVWALLLLSGMLVLSSQNPKMRAVILMAWGLLILWVVVCGSIMYKKRDTLKVWLQKIPLPWYVTFVLTCTSLALIEEAITTTMTNLAPLFGVKLGEAYITASTNYFDVVLFHSVIVFVPMFVAWAWLISRYNFRAGQAFILFGITGTVAESVTFGLQNIGMLGFWVLVYGLMVYLPVYAFSSRPRAQEPHWHHFLLAVLLPPLFNVILFPLSIFGYRPHPEIHFPPIL